MIKNINNGDLILFGPSKKLCTNEGKLIYRDESLLFYILNNNDDYRGSYPARLKDSKYKYSYLFSEEETMDGTVYIEKLNVSVEYYNERCHSYDNNK